MAKKDKDSFIHMDAKGSRAERLAAVAMGAKARYKAPIVCSARDDPGLVVPRVSTGIYGLDIATNGGLPLRRMILVYGEKSGGKTTLCLRGVSRFQQLCGNCYQPGVFEPGQIDMPDLKTGKVKKVDTQKIVDCPCGKPRDMIVLWNDAEGVWETDWPTKLGVWTEKILLMRPAWGEQGYDVISAFVNIQEVDLIVIDSVAAMTSAKELDATMQDDQQGVQARMNNRFIRAVVSGMNAAFQVDRPITLWAINQFREKIGVMFGDPRTLPGGKGQRFAATMEIEMIPKKVTLDENSGEPLVGDFEFLVKRNKVGPPGGRGKYRQCMADTDVFKIGDLMEHEAVIKKAADAGFINKPSQQIYEWGEKKFRGISTLERHFGEHPDEFEDLKDRMLRWRLGIKRPGDER